MSRLEDDPPKKRPAIVVGEDLSDHSVDELTERISSLTAEIERIERTIAAKRASADTASSFFKR